ncbi:hypothetical protein [Pseudomonas sp. MWU13-2100]|uniref:hypothetical protein n=1 Tax=Pseudomonas sp. MWU13-2100 TaxID=2935075 RepID=UPI00399B3916
MLNPPLCTFFDHSRHTLWIRKLEAPLDVLVFEGTEGTEGLSQLFNYRVDFTSTDGDIAAEQMLGQDARFSLHTAPHKLPGPCQTNARATGWASTGRA